MRTSVLIWLIILLAALPTHSQIIITSAGTGGGGFSGDGGHATAAWLYIPRGVTLDKNGDLFICDGGNRRVRKVSPAYGGIITTIAGNGIPGYSGDGYQAIYAQMDGAWDVALDSKGNIFLADGGNDVIRKVSTSGIISTYAGNGMPGYNGDGIPATAAKLNGPPSICFDSHDNLYICDRLNYRIRKVDSMGIISTVAGNGTIGYTSDGSAADTARIGDNWAVRVDRGGNIFFTDNNRIRKIDTNGRIATIGGNGIGGDAGDGGPAMSAELQVSAFCFDTSGNIYLCDAVSNKVRKIGADGTISRIAGTGYGGYSGDGGDALLAKMNGCSGIAVANNGDIFVSDHGNNRIRMVSNHITGVAQIHVTEPKLEVYPNPATDFLNIELHGVSAEEAEVSIRVIDGRLVGRYCMQPAAPLHLSANWPAGTYVVQVTTGTATLSKTITINTQK